MTNEVLDTLKEAYLTQDPAGELGQKAAELHTKWISFCWGSYDKETHANLTQMYVDDERFRKYYDNVNWELQSFQRCVWIYTGIKNKQKLLEMLQINSGSFL